MAKTTVTTSTRDVRPSCQVTAAINASDATLTPSRKVPAVLDFRIRGTSGPLTATSRNAGRKMATVERTAPGIPPRMKPIKVAVVKTGPGVTSHPSGWLGFPVRSCLLRPGRLRRACRLFRVLDSGTRVYEGQGHCYQSTGNR